MKVIIEIERDEEIERVKKIFKGERITVVKTRSDKKKILKAVFKKYNVKLPKNYTFDRETIHAR
ncbi:MAG: hypothetical protein A2Y66_06745 [Nitrospirae bacterium RBG_13_41_22]|nr:MAG: hypothetical protein A2Y66_06745 [Nitrospirae bacterium RBG_13_41_22]